ncbi:MAG TPA: SDR family oxidoreductase [Vicinamibacteria bacterium]|jgi:NAD(P)-dependent dehydrogenase (short-subunit alcohol dehydrogenase family)
MIVRGRAVLVTGGSRGLGAALGRELARRGARVVLVARGEAALQETVEGIRRSGGEAHGLVADVGGKEAVYPLVGSATALVGPLDVVVHNASALGPTPLRALSETECEDFARVMETNVVGPLRLTKAVVGSMVLRGQGLVVGISSDAGVAAYPGWGAYGTSKAALDHLLRTWAVELRDSGVRFLSVDPGEMDTAMHAEAMPEADRSSLKQPEEVASHVVDLVESADEIPTGARVEALRQGATA